MIESVGLCFKSGSELLLHFIAEFIASSIDFQDYSTIKSLALHLSIS